MKKFVLLIMMCIISLVARGQATSLVVDNQNPGSLSSKINFWDQQTLVNLKVTGYVNGSDMEFISKMMSDKSLHGVLDLTDANFVGMGPSGETNQIKEINEFEENDLHTYIKGTINHLLLPKRLTYIQGAFRKVYINTLTIGGALTKISPNNFYYAFVLGNLIIREGVDSIMGDNRKFFPGSTTLESIHFPNSLKYIDTTIPDYKQPGLFGGQERLMKVNLPDSIEYLQDMMFEDVPAFKDTIRLPKNLKEFYPTTFGHYYSYYDLYNGMQYVHEVRDSQVVFIPNNVRAIHFKIPNRYWECHVSNTVPIKIGNYYSDASKKIHVYVPKSALQRYQNSNWSAFTLHAEPNPALKVSFNKDSLELHKGSTAHLSASVYPSDADNLSVTWNSSDETIVKVDKNGVVTAVSSGKATIYVRITDNPSLIDSCLITVFQPASEIKLNSSDKTIKVGEAFNLTATIVPSDADDKSVIWTSSNDSIATVTEGKVTGVKAGTVMITATSVSNSNVMSQCAVTVLQPVEGIELDKNFYQLNNIGETVQLTATVLPKDASNKTVNWKSTAEDVCYVSNGKVVAVGYGTAIIIATTVDGGFMDVCKIQVPNVTGIDNIHLGGEESSYQIYTMDGRKIDRLQKGVNIVRQSNGKTRKIVIK